MQPMKLERVNEVIEILSRQHDKERLKVMSKIHAKYIIQVTGFNSISLVELKELLDRRFFAVVYSTDGSEEEQEGPLKLHIVDTTD